MIQWIYKELAQEPGVTDKLPVTPDATDSATPSYSLQPAMIFFVLVAVVGILISRRRGQQQQQQQEKKEQYGA
jgi:peptidyl-prolyl cis-trans isomerase B (cyclophilin B)